LGICTEVEKMCFCPCGNKMLSWQAQFHLQPVIGYKESRTDYCSDRAFEHIALMFHMETVAKLENVNGLLHRGLYFYMKELYKEYNGGYGHKALYHKGDVNYRQVEAYESRTMERMKKQLQDRLYIEEKKRLETERARRALEQELEEVGLQVLNKDKFDDIQDRSKNLHAMNLELASKKVRNPNDYEVARKEIDYIAHCLRAKYCMKHKLKVTIPLQFDLQQLFDYWYKNPEQDVLNLFRPIETSDQLIEFLQEWKVEIDVESSDLEGAIRSKSATRKKFCKLNTKAEELGESLTYFLSNIWMQMGNLVVEVKSGCFVKLFEPTKGGLMMTTEDQFKEVVNKAINNFIDANTLYLSVLEQAKAWYRAIGRIMIHSLVGVNEPTFHKRHLIPSYILPRFYRNLIFRTCSPEDNNIYPWAEVVDDLRDVELGSVIDSWIDQKYSAEKIFTQLIPEKFIYGRQCFIDALREGISIGGSFDRAGLLVKEIPMCMRQSFVFTSKQLGQLLKQFTSKASSKNSSSASSVNDIIISYFKSLDLDILDNAIFAKGSITADDITSILRVRFWTFNKKEQVKVPEELVYYQKALFDQIAYVIDECSKDDEGFPSRLIEFFTGFAYLPIVEDLKSDDLYPQPDPYGKSEFFICKIKV